MKIVITGGAGFIGSNAAEYFHRKGHDLIVLDNLSRKGSQENAARVQKLTGGKHYRVEKIDIRDAKAIQTFFKNEAKLDAVIHLAGQVAVTTSVVNPREDFEINALGTFNVLEGIRESGQRPIVLYSSTNKVYGGLHSVSVEELDRRYGLRDLKRGVGEEIGLDFHSPYGCSKGAADQYIRDYSRIYEIPTVVFRQSCIYGPNQLGIEDQGWIAWFCIASIFGRPLTVYGNGKQVRDILFIEDLLKLYELAIEKRKITTGRIYNVGGGPDFTLSLLELIEELGKRLGKPLPITYSDWRPGDQPIYVSDISKLKKDIGWVPKVDPSQGIDRLFAWVKENKLWVNEVLFGGKA